jgi:single-strand DNA-binding protein
MINKAILIGNLGSDPETSNPNESTLCKFSVATSETWKDRNGEKQESTEWHRIECWGKLAEICSQYLSKGSKVWIEGKIKTDKWETESGETRYSTKIVAKEVTFLSPPTERDSTPSASAGNNDSGDDLPF